MRIIGGFDLERVGRVCVHVYGERFGLLTSCSTSSLDLSSANPDKDFADSLVLLLAMTLRGTAVSLLYVLQTSSQPGPISKPWA